MPLHFGVLDGEGLPGSTILDVLRSRRRSSTSKKGGFTSVSWTEKVGQAQLPSMFSVPDREAAPVIKAASLR